jgi:flagellar hook-associated protein 1
MSSLFGILGIGANGLNASSFGISVASHDASNVGTDGFSRRNAVLEPMGPPMAGARATGARRVTDVFLDRRILGARAAAGSATAQTRTLETLDMVLSEGAGNLGNAWDQLQSALSDLASHPNDRAARTVLLERAAAMARSFNDAASSLASARAEADQRITDEVRQVNGRLHQIADLGNQISRSELDGQEASDLRDRRDQLVREVADYVPVTSVEDSSGRISLLLNGSLPLVQPEGQVGELQAQVDPATGAVHVSKIASGARVDISAAIDGGSIGGTLAARDGALAQAATDLDRLAFDLGAAFNTAHAAGFGLDGVGGRNLFDFGSTVSGAAAAMTVSADVAGQPDALAAASDPAAVPGDNRNALALVAVADARIAAGGTLTAGESMEALIGSSGAALATARGNQEHERGALDQLAQLRESVSGVSLDDEMVALTRYQRAYQASLKVVQAADDMLSELMALGRH